MDLTIALTSGIGVTLVLVTVFFLLAKKFRIFRVLAFPLYVSALAAGLRVFLVFEAGQHPVLDKSLFWILVFLVTIVGLRLLGLYIFDVFLYSYRGLRLPPLLPTVAMWTAYVLTALIVLPLAAPGLNVAPILATSAVTSLVLGLALQPILGNFFSGVVISVERPFRINDWIRYGDRDGRVVDITWRTTHLRTRDNDNLVIPNSKIADSEVLNYFYPHPLHLERIYVGVHYRTPPYRAKQAMLTAASRVEAVLEKPSPAVFLFDFGDSSITYELRAWIEDIAHKPKINNQIKSEIWEEFRRQGITIPFPIRTLEIEPRASTLGVTRPAEKPPKDALPGARLFVANGPDEGKTLRLDQGPVLVGRSADCDLQLTDPQTSKEHLRIEAKETGYLLTDLESHFGTRVNEERTYERTLNDLDRIAVGENLIIFEHDE